MTVRIFSLLVAAAATLAAQNAIEGSYPPPGYVLRWVDEFNGRQLDTAKWMPRTDVKMESSQRAGNLSVENGRLVIHLRRQDDRGKRYTGGGVISRERFRYGYWEARVKMHGGSGWHQSVWSMYAGTGDTTYPQQMRTEIDGMEFDSDVVWKGHMGLIRWQGPKSNRSSTCTPGVYRGALGFDATSAFHTYGYEWTEKNIRFYLDGDLRCVLEYPPSEGEHDRINFWLTAIAHEKLSGRVDDARLPGVMLVEHAAFYEKRDPQ